jgi:tryptophanyl-tRNA synthetase
VPIRVEHVDDDVNDVSLVDTLVALLRAFADRRTVAAVEERYRRGEISYGEVKALLADAIEAHVAPMRRRYRELLADPAELDARLAEGEQHARSASSARSPGQWSPLGWSAVRK